jgi:hypothetical protein
MGTALLDQADCMTSNVTPEQLRADAVEALKEPGRRRLELLRQIAEIDDELRPLISRAREVEVAFTRITELTGVAPNTVRSWLK